MQDAPTAGTKYTGSNITKSMNTNDLISIAGGVNSINKNKNKVLVIYTGEKYFYIRTCKDLRKQMSLLW